MQVPKTKGQLDNILLNPQFTELLRLLQMCGQLAAANKAHFEIQTDVCLEAFFDVHNERMLDFICDIFLLNYLLNLVIIKDFIFSHAFHGVVFVCLFIFD